jgi:hypothetical protein
MISPARRRDFWVLPLMILVIAAAAVIVRAGATPPASGVTPPAGVVGGADRAEKPATATPAQDADQSARAPTYDELPADSRAQFDLLPEGTVLIACHPTFAKYPEGVTPSVSLAWHQAHPGWGMLEHGYCYDNPDLIRPVEPALVDVP